MSGILNQLTQALRGVFQWWVVIAPWEQALRVRRGKSVRLLRAGIHLRIPMLDRFFVQSTRLRMADMPIQTITTADGKTITLKCQLGYRIEDLGVLYDTLHDAEGTLINVAQMEVADHVSIRSLGECEPKAIAAEVGGVLRERMSSYGLGDVRLSLTDYALVKTYRLITQDIWSNSGPMLDTRRDHTRMDQ